MFSVSRWEIRGIRIWHATKFDVPSLPTFVAFSDVARICFRNTFSPRATAARCDQVSVTISNALLPPPKTSVLYSSSAAALIRRSSQCSRARRRNGTPYTAIKSSLCAVDRIYLHAVAHNTRRASVLLRDACSLTLSQRYNAFPAATMNMALNIPSRGAKEGGG